MTTRWDPTAYIKALPDMPLAELCAKLRGEYNDGVTYEAHPMSKEAARRLEAMQAEIERLKDIEAMARSAGVQFPSRIGGLFGG
jgi:hypothetical protein